MSKLTTYLDGDPLKAGVAYADAVAGLHAAFAIMAALRYRRAKGVGQRIDLSMREALTHIVDGWDHDRTVLPRDVEAARAALALAKETPR